MAEDPATFSLQSDDRVVGAAALARFLSDNADRPVRIDAAGVSLVGALVLQVLIAGRTAWADSGLPFDITNRSDRLTECFALLGWSPDAQP